MNNTPQVRIWTRDDYPLFLEWWKAHNHDPIPMGILPPTGYILERGGVPTCAMFAYLTVAIGVATFRWSLAEPGKTMAETFADFDILFVGVKQTLNALGYNVFFADAPRAVARYLKHAGFVEQHQGNTFLILSN